MCHLQNGHSHDTTSYLSFCMARTRSSSGPVRVNSELDPRIAQGILVDRQLDNLFHNCVLVPRVSCETNQRLRYEVSEVQ